MITQAINLNLIPGQVLPRVNVSQYDYGSRTLEFKLFNGNQSFTLTSSMTANISGTKADMHGFEYDATVDTTNQKIVADLTQQMTATAGDVTCELIIKKSGERLGTCNFVISVEKAALGDDIIISDTELPAIIAEATAQMEAAAQSASEAASSAQAAEESADIAEIYGAHPPYIGVNGNWYVYNVTTQQYEDSGVKAQGPLSGLTDVEISNLAENDIIAYDATAQKWKNSSEFQTLTNQVKDMNNVYGSKNLTPFSVETQTINGVTITVQDDGSIILNGTATAYTYVGLTKNGIPLESGKCILSGVSGGSTSSYFLFTSTSGGATLYQEIDGQRTSIRSVNGDSAIFDINKMNTTVGSSYVNPSEINIRLTIANGYTCNNVLIKPMIRLASITDDSYEPYAKTNQQLTKDVKHTGNIEPMLNVLGAKNLLSNNAMSQTINGVVFTVNDDGSITANGTATAVVALYLYGEQSFADENIFKGMKMKGCPSGSISNNYSLYAQGFTTPTLDNPVWYTDTGNGVILGNDNYIRVYIRIASGVTVSNLTFRPMICLTELEDDTYAPYAKTNQQLTEDTTSLLDNLEVNGAVNMLPNEEVSQVNSASGLTITVNDDKSVTISPTSGTYPFTTTAQLTFTFCDMVGKIPNGIYKLSGCPSGGSAETYFLYVNSTGDTGTHRRDIGEGTTFNYVNDTTNSVYMRIMNGTVLTKALTFKPMITIPSYKGDYVPYAKSNKELTEDVAEASATVTENGITCSFKKWGKIVQLNFEGSFSSNITKDIPFLTLPSGFIPKMNYTMLSTNALSSLSDRIAIGIRGSGGIVLSGKNAAEGDALRGSCTYIAQ